MKKIIMLLAFLIAPQILWALETQTVQVKGMVCSFCAQGITKKFQAQKEVEKIEVSLEQKTVTLTYKQDQKLSKDQITHILKDAGYEVSF